MHRQSCATVTNPVLAIKHGVVDFYVNHASLECLRIRKFGGQTGGSRREKQPFAASFPFVEYVPSVPVRKIGGQMASPFHLRVPLWLVGSPRLACRKPHETPIIRGCSSFIRVSFSTADHPDRCGSFGKRTPSDFAMSRRIPVRAHPGNPWSNKPRLSPRPSSRNLCALPTFAPSVRPLHRILNDLRVRLVKTFSMSLGLCDLRVRRYQPSRRAWKARRHGSSLSLPAQFFYHQGLGARRKSRCNAP